MLAAVPERYGTVGAFLRMFVPRPTATGAFAERMTVRFSALAPINDPASLYKPIRKVVHRAHPGDPAHAREPRARRQPVRAAARLVPDRGVPLPAPLAEQCEHKATLQGTAFEKHIDRPPHRRTTRRCSRRSKSGTIGDYYDVARGLATRRSSGASRQGRLVVDTRLRDALRSLRPTTSRRRYALPSEARALAFPLPTLVEDAEYAVEAAVLGEADVVRLQRRLDTLERRLASLELRLPTRVYRKVVAARPKRRSLEARRSARLTARSPTITSYSGRARRAPPASGPSGEPVEEPRRGEHVAVRSTSTLPSPNASSASRRAERAV